MTRSGRAGPLLFCSCRKVGKRQAQGSFTPLRIPGPKWGAGRPPLWKPPSPRWRAKEAIKLRNGRTPRRLRGWSFGAVGEGRERVRARHGCRTSTASFGGLRPLAPTFPKGDVCRSCAPAHGTASETALRATPSQICAEAPAAQAARSSVTPLARLWPQATLARPPAGESQRGRSPLWPVFAYFLLARK